VLRTRVGYAGGTRANPTYRRIGDHMETVQIDFDPGRISYRQLLEEFFAGHNPVWASPIRQYASAIFTHDQEQETMARQALSEAQRRYGKKVSTQLLPYTGFTRAEDYHQKYYLRNTRALMDQYRGRFATQDEFTDSTAAARVNGYLGGNGTLRQLEAEASGLGISSGAVDALRKILRKKGR